MTEWIKQAATQILPLAASGICNDEDGNVKPTADVIEEIIHDAYMDRDGELRDLLCCPPDCDLTSWAKRLGNFWHDLEGGQVVESLKQQLADLESQYDRFEQIIQDADSQAYKLRELLDGKSPGRTVFAEMLVCLPEMVTQVQEMKEQLATSNARCAAMQKWVMFATREDAGQVMVAIDAEIEQIAKDHRAMEVMRAKKYAPMSCNPQHGDGWYVRDRSGQFVGKWGAEAETDPADAILAAAWRPLEGGSGRRVGNGHDT
jgi:hypothetical protein